MHTIHIVPLDPIFRQSTKIVYPPFKKGRYLEEYFYEYVTSHTFSHVPTAIYIPAFWTNLQINPSYSTHAPILQSLLDRAVAAYPVGTPFFTVCQHDDGPMLRLPENTTVFGACTGNVPIPLIYEDTDNRLTKEVATGVTGTVDTKFEYLANFIGTITHPARSDMVKVLYGRDGIEMTVHTTWTNQVSENNAKNFIDTSLQSRFILAPRGYGRSSFRYFEALLLDRIPVYVWDDIEWLPYKEYIDYSAFSFSVHRSKLDTLYDTLASVSAEKYEAMREEARRVAPWFTLEGMSRYILSRAYNQHIATPPHPFSIIVQQSGLAQ